MSSTPFSRLKIRLIKFEVILSLLLLLMPAILWAIDQQLRSSISNYVYMASNEWFYILLTTAGIMFVYNGVLDNKRWYNIVLGCSLVGVVATPHLKSDFYSTIHLAFAALFFAGSVFVMIYFSSVKQRIYKVAAGVLITFGIVGHFAFNWYSLYWGEWIGILPICIHFIGESIGKVD